MDGDAAGARGARVVLIDPSHPREKPCGGGITGRALALVGERCPPADCPPSAFAPPGSSTRRAARPPPSPLPTDATALVVASRAEFDGSLLTRPERAGADLLATRVTRYPSGRRRLRRSDRVERIAHRRPRSSSAPTARTASCGGRLHAVPPRSAVDRHRLFRARRHERRDRHRDDRGSAWLHLVVSAARSPRDRHLRAGRRRASASRRCASIVRALDRDDAHRATARSSSRTRGRFRRCRRAISLSLDLAGPGWLTVGDAAGLVDPITREGIFFALQSAVAGRRRALVDRRRPVDATYADARARGHRGRTRARGALQSRVLPPALHAAAGRRACNRASDPRGDGRPRRRDAELSRPEMATGANDGIGLAWQLLTKHPAEAGR